jgi:hypothetical protein
MLVVSYDVMRNGVREKQGQSEDEGISSQTKCSIVHSNSKFQCVV